MNTSKSNLNTNQETVKISPIAKVISCALCIGFFPMVYFIGKTIAALATNV